MNSVSTGFTQWQEYHGISAMPKGPHSIINAQNEKMYQAAKLEIIEANEEAAQDMSDAEFVEKMPAINARVAAAQAIIDQFWAQVDPSVSARALCQHGHD